MANQKIQLTEGFSKVDFRSLIPMPASAVVIYKGDRNILYRYSIEGRTYVVKAFGVPNLFNKFVYVNFRASKAKRSFYNAKKLIDAGVSTPVPIAFSEERTAVFLAKSYYVSKSVNYISTIREVLYGLDFKDAKTIIKLYTRAMFKLYENNIEFLDNTPGNFLISKEGGEYDVYLVDLNRIKFRKLNLKDRLKNLSKITNDREKLTWIAEEYARISKEPKEFIVRSLFDEMNAFQAKRKRKKKIKSFFKL